MPLGWSMSGSTPFLTLEAVALRSGTVLLFEGLTWRIHNDEHWVVVGPNGSGKSTLLGAFDGRTPVVRGEVWYHFASNDPAQSYPTDGTVPESMIAYVSQEEQAVLAACAASYHQARWNAWSADELPTAEAVLIQRTGAAKAAIRRMAKRMHIAHRLGHHLADLSNGELRRLLLVEALLKRPRLLVLDDPFSGLDATARDELRALIEQIMGEGIRLVIVVRRVEEIPQGTTHLLLAEEGSVTLQAPLSAARHLPQLRAFFRPKPPQLDSTQSLSATAPGDVLVELRAVTVRYGRTTILRDLSWTVRAGERWLLTGPNGAGKSTLLSLLLGDNPQAYANDVRLFGKRRGQGESIWDIRRRIGWVSPELQWHYPGDTATFDVVASGCFDSIGLMERPSPAQRRLVRHWLEHFSLPGTAPFAALGAGQQRMALLARALVKSPELLLLDEPCQGLDTDHQNLFHAALLEVLAGRPVALVYVTHHEEEVPSAGFQVLRMASGRACVG